MASSPPPFAPSFGNSPREQAKYAREAARAQRRLLREQTRAVRRRSILGPLLVLALGVVLLLGRLGRLHTATALAWYGRWWPVFLIGGGVVLVLEWIWDEYIAQQYAPGQTPYVRRSLGGGAILLLILLGLSGSALHGSTPDRVSLFKNVFWDQNGLAEFFGERHEGNQTLDLELPADTSFVVANPHGDISLTGTSTDGRVHVSIQKHVYSSSDEDTRLKLNALSPTSEISAGALRLSLPSQDGNSADLSITVPPATSASLSANHGSVTVSGLSGSLQITSNHGDVDLSSISGAVDVHLSGRGSSLAAHDIRGGLSVVGVGQDLTLTHLAGAVALNGDFYGDTHLEQLDGPVRFHTSRTDVSLQALKGSFDISPHAELTGVGLAGPIMIRTYSRNITLEDVSGDVMIINRNGTVALEKADTAGNVDIANQNGAITVTLPEHVGVVLHAETHDGSIEDDFMPQATRAGRTSILDGMLGAGSGRVNLRTANSDITIHKR